MSGSDGFEGLPAALRDRYLPKAVLGEGSFGVVFQAEDRTLVRDVAVKVFRTVLDPDARQRFLREVRALGALEHPNVVTIFDADVTEDGAWIVMELLEGSPSGLAAPRDPLGIMLDVAEGLQAVHDQSLLHRDVKPANLFVTAGGEGVLLDLGLVANPASTAVTATGELVGTLRYLAPELFRGKPASRASDWYAWGASLFELIEGRPLREEVPVAAFMAGVELPPPEFRRIPTESAPARVIRACVADHPDRRPANLVALRHLLAKAPAEAPVHRTGKHPGAATGRWWLGSGVALGVVVVTVGVASVSLAPALDMPSLSPPPKADTRPAVSLYGVARSALASLRARPELDGDPRQYFRQLRTLAGFDPLLDGLRAAPDLTRLAPDVRALLRDFDEELEARGRMPLFGAATRPLPEGAASHTVRVGRPGGEGKEEDVELDGWAAEAIREVNAAWKAMEAGLDHLAERPREELLHVPTILALRVLGRPGAGTLFSLPSTPENARYLGEMLRPGAPHTHRALVAGLRALDEIDGQDRAHLAFALRRALNSLDPTLLCGLATLPPWLLFGGEPRTPEGSLLVGRFAVVLALIHEDAGASNAELRGYAERHLMAARDDGDLPPGGIRAQLAVQEMIRYLVRFDDWGAIVREVGQLRSALRDHPTKFQRFLLLELGQVILVLVTRGELPRAELEVLDRGLSAWRAANPSVPRWASPDSLHRDVRAALAEPGSR